MQTKQVLLALCAATVAVAQDADGVFPIDIDKVDKSQKPSWCRAEYSACGTLCGGSPQTNTCDDPTLKFKCTCQNGTAPGLQYYKDTMPFFICMEAYRQCNEANANNLAGQSNCTSSIKAHCGSQELKNANVGGAGSDAGNDKGTDNSNDNKPSTTGDASPSEETGNNEAPNNTNGASSAHQHMLNAAAVIAAAVGIYHLN